VDRKEELDDTGDEVYEIPGDNNSEAAGREEERDETDNEANEVLVDNTSEAADHVEEANEVLVDTNYLRNRTIGKAPSLAGREERVPPPSRLSSSSRGNSG